MKPGQTGSESANLFSSTQLHPNRNDTRDNRFVRSSQCLIYLFAQWPPHTLGRGFQRLYDAMCHDGERTKKKHLPVHSVFYSITCTNKTPANFKKVKGDANSTGILPLKCPAGSCCLWQSFGNHFYGTDSKAISKHTSMKINLHLFLKTYKSLFLTMHYDLQPGTSLLCLFRWIPPKSDWCRLHSRFEMGVNALMSQTWSPPEHRPFRNPPSLLL